ncbi:MAG: ABC transporter ATP-binding protein [Variibacter sp.]|nr:ABC transporter ATP-binding protein [Variibacter sp.]
MTGAPTLETRNLTVRFGGHVAVDDVSCAFARGTLTAIVGPTGAGKTPYVNLSSGPVAASAGEVRLHGEDISRRSIAARTHKGLGRAFQLTNLFPNLSVRENVRLVMQAKARRRFDLFSLADSRRDWTEAAERVLAQVRLSAAADAAVTTLSHGDQRKLEVALLLALDSAVVMLDEPTAGMSIDEVPVILDLIGALKADGTKTILLVEHKMDVIRSLADRIVVLHNGRLVADGAPREVIASPVVQEAYLGIAPDA